MGQQRRVLTPERSALHTWGSELRALRDAQGLSLRQLALHATYDASYLGRLERGDQHPSEKVARTLDAALGAGGELIRLWLIADKARQGKAQNAANPSSDEANTHPQQAGHGSDLDVLPGDHALSEEDSSGVTMPCRASDGRIIWVTVPRRTFLLGGVAAAAGSMVARPGSYARAFRAAPLGAGDPNPIEHLRTMRLVLIDSDNLFGPQAIIPTVHQQVRIIQQLRAGQSGADRKALLHLQAEFSEFASWLHQDAGDWSQAQHWLDRALDWSHAVDDREMAAYVMARKSQLAGDMRDHETAIDLADAAIAMALPGSRLQAAAHTYKAHGLALAHEPKGAALALDAAHAIAADRADQESPWAVWLDEAYVDVQRGRCLTLTGSHQQAADVFVTALRNLPPSYRRDRGVYLAREAQAHAGTRDPEHAAAAAMLALDIAEETSSGRIVSELAALDAQLDPWAAVPAVADFREALTSVIPQQVERH
jgi:tetratricopeptide (TPR) repeat protein/transcriptional regulator with XRE-family HTH domain